MPFLLHCSKPNLGMVAVSVKNAATVVAFLLEMID